MKTNAELIWSLNCGLRSCKEISVLSVSFVKSRSSDFSKLLFFKRLRAKPWITFKELLLAGLIFFLFSSSLTQSLFWITLKTSQSLLSKLENNNAILFGLLKSLATWCVLKTMLEKKDFILEEQMQFQLSSLFTFILLQSFCESSLIMRQSRDFNYLLPLQKCQVLRRFSLKICKLCTQNWFL